MTEENIGEDSNVEIPLPPLPGDAVEISMASFVDERDLPEPVEDSQAPAFVSDPTPTLSDPEKEFNSSQVQNALDDDVDEGGVSRAVSKSAPIQSAPQAVIKEEKTFSPNWIQNGLADSDNEGGIVPNKTTTINSDEVVMEKSSDFQETKEGYRLYGFTVQYPSKGGFVTKQVSEYHNDVQNAIVSVCGSQYLMIANNAFVIASIVGGIPKISCGDEDIFTYVRDKDGVGGGWRK